MTKIYLDVPGPDPGYGGFKGRLQSAPTGLLYVAKALEEKGFEDTEVFDGNFYDDFQELKKRARESHEEAWFGFYSIYSNYKEVLRRARMVKREGKNVNTIVGGPYAIMFERMLKNRDFLDYVCVGDGEPCMPPLVNMENIENIPNLAYRENGEIVLNRNENDDMNRVFDLERLFLEPYDRNVHFPITSGKGCDKRDKEGPCIYCSMDHKTVFQDPKVTWDQIRYLTEKGFYRFFLTRDNQPLGRLYELLKARPADLEKVRLRVYEDPSNVDSDMVSVLEALNVDWLFLGVESFDENILRRANRRGAVDDIYRAIDLLSDVETLQIPVMYGLPGETPDTMRETYEEMRILTEEHGNITLLSSKAVPIYGTQLFFDLKRNRKVRAEYPGIETADLLDYKRLFELQLKYFTDCSSEKVDEFIQKTLALSPDKMGFGV